MKRIVFLLILGLTVLGSKQLLAQSTPPAQTQGQVKWYYYPSSNVYYNPSANTYWYYNTDNNTWTSVTELPASIVLVKTPRYDVTYNGQEVWKENPEHLKKYKVKKNGHIKEKPMKHEKKED